MIFSKADTVAYAFYWHSTTEHEIIPMSLEQTRTLSLLYRVFLIITII